MQDPDTEVRHSMEVWKRLTMEAQDLDTEALPLREALQATEVWDLHRQAPHNTEVHRVHCQGVSRSKEV